MIDNEQQADNLSKVQQQQRSVLFNNVIAHAEHVVKEIINGHDMSFRQEQSSLEMRDHEP